MNSNSESYEQMPIVQNEKNDVEQVPYVSKEEQIDARNQHEQPMIVAENGEGETELSTDDIE